MGQNNKRWKWRLILAVGMVVVALVSFGAFEPKQVESQSLLDLLGGPRVEEGNRFGAGRSQILAMGIDAPLVVVDRRYELSIIALVREGTTPIDRVEAFFVGEDGELESFQLLEPTGDVVGGDRIYRGASFNFRELGFNEEDFFDVDITLDIGKDEGDLLVAVFDQAGRSHFFPNLEFARAPAYGYDEGQYSSIFQ